jgi:hypothetical protein
MMMRAPFSPDKALPDKPRAPEKIHFHLWRPELADSLTSEAESGTLKFWVEANNPPPI